MNLFDLPKKEFEKELDKLVKSQTREQLLCDLVKCGLELSKEDKAKWIDPVYIDTEEEADKLIEALEKAAEASVKETNVDYENIADKNKIKEMFDYGKE